MSGNWSLEAEFARERKRRARDSFQQAYRLQREAMAEADRALRRDLFEGVVAHYRRSLEFLPTAETYTFLGWAYSFLGDFKAAISSCQHAISLDPDYGNPYNDIGVYLMEEGAYDQAIAYLQKAIGAKRYDCLHYAHYNLGRVLLVRGRVCEAESEFRRALEIEPQYVLARVALHQLEARKDPER
ncbi:MAG: tetratricopeptide repeat protein [Candidatus Sericytochromatia bacterium]|uniref:Tetratricopeptide repeat protein n=1 Tax=Candidatus Tanganyikabacteria bacterium TaxID=2961651 RepID=A0A938BPI6_9BACT|nr:tetratricopeptide repeat protein [Candidatus Tanganyikabacteria bacterium]